MAKMGFFDKIQAKIELYRLEQRYTRRKNRATFTTGAQYVDGEYIYPNSEASSPISVSKNSTGSADKEFWRAPDARNQQQSFQSQSSRTDSMARR